VGVKIKRRDVGNVLSGTIANAVIFMQSNRNFEVVKEDQFILAKCGVARYSIMAPNIVINGMPFEHDKTCSIYKIIGSYTLTIEIEALVALVEQEEEEMNKIKMGSMSKLWDTFDNIMYSRRVEAPLPPKAISMNIKNIANGQQIAKYLSIDNRLRMTKPTCLGYNEEIFPENQVVITELQPEIVVYRILDNYRQYLRIIREMVSVWNTPELIKSHANIMMMLNNLKF
jgi:hypothetical protein